MVYGEMQRIFMGNILRKNNLTWILFAIVFTRP